MWLTAAVSLQKHIPNCLLNKLGSPPMYLSAKVEH